MMLMMMEKSGSKNRLGQIRRLKIYLAIIPSRTIETPSQEISTGQDCPKKVKTVS